MKFLRVFIYKHIVFFYVSIFVRKATLVPHRCLYPGYPETKYIGLCGKVIEEGVDYVEIDCDFTKDFQLIVSNDSEMNRCTGWTW